MTFRYGHIVVLVATLLLSAGPPPAVARGNVQETTPQAPGQESPEGSAPEAQPLENPVAFTKESIARGRKHYLRHCQTCHGFDGRAQENVDFVAADLTEPSSWYYGTKDGDIFRTTRDGAGEDMPPFSDRLRDPQIWDLVNYLRNLGPEELRPPLVEAESE